MKITRAEIITNMCYGWRQDFGLDKTEGEVLLSSGTTIEEREHLWNKMAQIFDDEIAPYMEFRK